MAPGTVVPPAKLEVGDLVQARDVPDQFWYQARVIEKFYRGPQLAVKVHFSGFPKSHDKDFVARDKAVRESLSLLELKKEQAQLTYGHTYGRQRDGTWMVESIIDRKLVRGRHMWLLRFRGWSEAHDLWTATPPAELRVEYEQTQQQLEVAARAAAQASGPRPPPVPFTTALTAELSDAALQALKDDCVGLLAYIGETCAIKVSRAGRPLAEVRIIETKDVSAAKFLALQACLVDRAAKLVPPENLADAVTQISSLRRGLRPVDTFSLMNEGVLNEIVGAGVFNINDGNHGNGAAVKMVPPIDFFLRAKRQADGEVGLVKELAVKAHIVTLVPNLQNPGAPIFRIASDAFEYPASDIDAYKLCMAQMLVATPAAPVELRAWGVAVVQAV